MNIWKPQDKFHKLCIDLWSIGCNPGNEREYFLSNNEPFNINWINMYLALFNEHYINYCYWDKLNKGK